MGLNPTRRPAPAPQGPPPPSPLSALLALAAFRGEDDLFLDPFADLAPSGR